MPHYSSDDDIRRFKEQSVATLRRQFEDQPPERQEETLERVWRLLAAERKRKQKSPSYLMQRGRDIYG